MVINSATSTRTRVAWVRAEYPNQLGHSGSEGIVHVFVSVLFRGQMARGNCARPRRSKGMIGSSPTETLEIGYAFVGVARLAKSSRTRQANAKKIKTNRIWVEVQLRRLYLHRITSTVISELSRNQSRPKTELRGRQYAVTFTKSLINQVE